MASKVYFMDDHAGRVGESTPFKAVKLLRDAGIKDLFKPGDTVGIKVHMGEYGNSLNLRPKWVSAIVDEVKRLGGNPVIVESNIMTSGYNVGREDTPTHRKVAASHGFTEETMGCPIWLPEDGMDIEGIKCEVPNGVYLNHTFISKHMAKLDACIVVSHFKGHAQGVFGGALKNVGIGMASNKGKAVTHFVNHPKYGFQSAPVNQAAVQEMMQQPRPNFVDHIVTNCPFNAFEIKDGELIKHNDRCVGCGACLMLGFFFGLLTMPEGHAHTTPVAIADSASGIINKLGKDKWMFVNYAFDVTPGCDCCQFHDRPMVPNIGTFVSKDPVAVDMACLEASEALSAIPGSTADTWGFGEPNTERYTNCSSAFKCNQWSQINAGVFNGLGTSEYVLVESEPLSDEEVKAWFFDYNFENPVTKVWAETIRKGNHDTEGVPACDEPRLSWDELQKKPVGKVGELDISVEL